MRAGERDEEVAHPAPADCEIGAAKAPRPADSARGFSPGQASRCLPVCGPARLVARPTTQRRKRAEGMPRRASRRSLPARSRSQLPPLLCKCSALHCVQMSVKLEDCRAPSTMLVFSGHLSSSRAIFHGPPSSCLREASAALRAAARAFFSRALLRVLSPLRIVQLRPCFASTSRVTCHVRWP